MLNEKQAGEHRDIGPLVRKPAPPPDALSAPLPGTKVHDGRAVTVRERQS